jgi:hypothetical protein
MEVTGIEDKQRPDSDLPSHLSRRFLEHQLKLASELGLKVIRDYLSPDYSVESLERMEHHVLPQTPEQFKEQIRALEDQSVPRLWFFSMGFGSYFGEVIIRNLGGKWKYPSRILVFLCLWGGYISPVYRHWYVVVGKQKVPVFDIMKSRLEMGAKGVSLVRIYREIEKGVYDRKKKIE